MCEGTVVRLDIFLSMALDVGERQVDYTDYTPRHSSQYRLNRRLGGSQDMSEKCGKEKHFLYVLWKERRHPSFGETVYWLLYLNVKLTLCCVKNWVWRLQKLQLHLFMCRHIIMIEQSDRFTIKGLKSDISLEVNFKNHYILNDPHIWKRILSRLYDLTGLDEVRIIGIIR